MTVLLGADPASIQRAADALGAGDVVAFPTETVYGLGARADRPLAVRKIYAMKGRPAENPSIVHVASADAAFALARGVPEASRALAAAFWPGPLTLVVEVRPGAVAPEVTAGGSTVAVRVPRHPVALAILRATSLPIAAPSANVSSHISPTTALHVRKSFGDDLVIVDGGPTGFGIESTIVDVTREPFVVLRRGSISVHDLAEVAPVVDRADAVAGPGERMRAPGALARHYAPRVPLRVAARAELDRVAAELAASIGVPASSAGLLANGSPPPVAERAATIVLPAEPTAFARDLYAALHRLEDAPGVRFIVAEAVPEGAAWDAVRDRLRRASR
jgi:L-threonylcarbamoyladenylate synthase